MLFEDRYFTKYSPGPAERAPKILNRKHTRIITAASLCGVSEEKEMNAGSILVFYSRLCLFWKEKQLLVIYSGVLGKPPTDPPAEFFTEGADFKAETDCVALEGLI